MFLSELKLWNFRKYSYTGDTLESSQPGLHIHFHKGVNLLIGENDSGKTAIIDAIRYALRTHSGEYIQIEEKDFYQHSNGTRTDEFKIECTFNDLSHQDQGLFWEWLSNDEPSSKYQLKIWLYAKRKDNVINVSFSAGPKGASSSMDSEARNLLKVVYLKPLRDAHTDMTHGYKSRLAQILSSHPLFSTQKDSNGEYISHKLEIEYTNLKNNIENYFLGNEEGSVISNNINEFLTKHFLINGDSRAAKIKITGGELTDILHQLDLVLEKNKSGLGTLNLLCIAAEMLLFSNQDKGLKLTLIEELEAHLHPQYQLRLIDFISNSTDDKQFILTTHSITLASKIRLENLIVLKNNTAYSMASDYTCMTASDYRFLERFLDATKANLFFASGLIMVEGDAENLLIPSIAEAINRPLHKYGISVINAGNTAYKRYVSIFNRRDNNNFNLPISVITDLDIRAIEYYKDKDEKREIPTVWLMDDIKGELERKNPEVNYEVFPKIIESKSALENAIRTNKKDGFPKPIEKNIKELTDILDRIDKREINKEILCTIREIRRQKLEKSIMIDNVKLYLPQFWTLEYEIASSGLYKLLRAAVLAAKEEKLHPEEIIDDNKLNDIWDIVVKEYPNSHSLTLQDSYDIFKPLNDGDVSKAITAQYLSAMILGEIPPTKNGKFEKTEVIKILKTDSNLKYIIDAIFHVTKN